MNLYEVFRWGNDSEDLFTGGPDGLDTCFLVRASSLEHAAQLVDAVLASPPSQRVQNWAEAIHLLGADHGSQDAPRILRGPYLQHAYNHGWPCWHRDSSSGPWVESR